MAVLRVTFDRLLSRTTALGSPGEHTQRIVTSLLQHNFPLWRVYYIIQIWCILYDANGDSLRGIFWYLFLSTPLNLNMTATMKTVVTVVSAHVTPTVDHDIPPTVQ